MSKPDNSSSRAWRTVAAVAAWVGVIAYPLALAAAFPPALPVGPGETPGGTALLVAAVLPVLTVGLLRRHPLPALAFLLVGAFWVSTVATTWPPFYLQLVVVDLAVAYTAATRGRLESVGAASVALLVQVASVPYFHPAPQTLAGTYAFVLLALLAAWLVGNSVRSRRRYAEALRDQATAQAVTAERLRIARELHDQVAHSIGIIAIQAGMGTRVMDTQPGEARNALATIEATSRETLAGLRRTLGALRQADPEPHPQPGLADVEALAASTAAAGVEVEVRWEGLPRPLPPEIDLSAYRIIQEAVTNVVRHAGTANCRVTVGYGDKEVSVEVVDDGRAAGRPAGRGFGLVGMRERVALLRGRLTAGPREEGGFRVSAALPAPAEVRT